MFRSHLFRTRRTWHVVPGTRRRRRTTRSRPRARLRTRSTTRIQRVLPMLGARRSVVVLTEVRGSGVVVAPPRQRGTQRSALLESCERGTRTLRAHIAPSTVSRSCNDHADLRRVVPVASRYVLAVLVARGRHAAARDPLAGHHGRRERLARSGTRRRFRHREFRHVVAILGP